MTNKLTAICLFPLFFFSCKPKADTSKKEADPIQAYMERPAIKILTKAILDTIPDEDLGSVIFDNISINMTGDNRNELEIVKTLSPGQQALYSTTLVEGEVNNGGFNQFYYNSSGKFARMAVKGFETFGAKEFAAIMQAANDTYDSIKVKLDEMNDGTVEKFSKSYENNPLNTLDEQFYYIYETDSLNQKRINYIRAHAGEFTQE